MGRTKKGINYLLKKMSRSSNRHINHEEMTKDLDPLPNKKHEINTNVYREEVHEDIHNIPIIQILEKIETRNVITKVPRKINQQKVEVLERTIEIPKPYREEKIEYYNEVKYIDKVVGQEVVTEKERIIEKPVVILQERIIPVPKRVVEEKIIEIPPEEYLKIVPQAGYEASIMQQKNRPMEALDDEIIETINKDGTKSTSVYSKKAKQHPDYEIKSRHTPVAVEIPFTHYIPKPVERIVERIVPIPIELE